MKKLFLFSIIVAFALNANAAKWRVNNTPGIQADFVTPDVAVASPLVSAGDTIYIEGSQTSYNVDIDIYKPLVIQGPGYFLTQNPKTQNFKASAVINNINFHPGSNGSIVKGLYLNSNIEIDESNITIENNYISGSIGLYGYGLSNLTNLKISKNFILQGIILINPWNYTINNLFISNNYIVFGYYYTSNNCSIGLNNNSSGIIINNVIQGDGSGTNIQSMNCAYQNNIFINCGITDTISNAFVYNLCDGTQLPIGDGTQIPVNFGNILNVNMANVFVGATGNSTDGQYMLQAGSPATGVASDGGDCGMYGGGDPYQLSGISGPAIYSIYMPNAGLPASGLNVTVKAKAY